jgi:hypothetical protein
VSLKVKSTVTLGFLILILSLLLANVNVKGSTNFSSSFDDFDINNFATNGCTVGGCHVTSPTSIYGSGSIIIITPAIVEAGVEFTANISISGFTEAASQDIAVGFRSVDGNNSVLGSFNDRVNETAILNGSGNLDVLFDLSIPTEGNYNLTALAVWADLGDDKRFYYLYSNTSITITPSADSEAPIIRSVLLDDIQASNSSADLSETVSIKVNATDNGDIKEVSAKIDGTPLSELTLNIVSYLYEYSFNTYALQNGPIILEIYAEDTVGNNATVAYSLTITNTAVMGDITSYKMVKSEIVIGDGVIDDYWENIQDKFIIEELSTISEKGWVKSTHDDYYLYMLVAYANEKITWIAFELDASVENMADNNDGWIFGEGEISYYGDAYYLGDAEHPAVDNRNDISYEMFLSEEEKFNYIEFKRPLVTNDVDGNDIDLKEGNLYNIKIASNGKATYHKDTDKLVYTLAISQAFPAGNTDTTTTTIPTETKTPAELKDDRIINFFILSGLGVSLNLILIGTIFIFLRRK